MYATKDFAGGELVRSVYHSISDLIDYASDPMIAEVHKKRVESLYPLTGEKFNGINYEILNEKIEELWPTYLYTQQLRSLYKYGVIYCYKVTKQHYSKLKHRDCMGIICKEPLPKSCLEAKLIFDDNSYLETLYANLFKVKPLESSFLTWRNRLKAQ